MMTTRFACNSLPTNALLSMWDPKAPGFGAGTHGMNSAMIPGGPYAAGGPAGTVPAKSIKPFKSIDLYIANEAFHPAGECGPPHDDEINQCVLTPTILPGVGTDCRLGRGRS